MTPEEYCQQKTSSSGSSFYYSFLFLSSEQRLAMTALYAYCREVDDVVDNCREISVARVKLNWWREETQRLFAKQPRHPVTRALLTHVNRLRLNPEYFHAIIDGMQMDLDQTHYQSFSDLKTYCYRAAGVVGLLSAKIFGYQNSSTEVYAKNLGIALQLTNILRDVREDAQRGRVYIPSDELTAHSVSADMLNCDNASADMKKLFMTQAQRAQSYYNKAYAALTDEDKYTQRCGLIMGAIYEKLLHKIVKLEYPIMQNRVSLSPWQKIFTAWSVARQQKKFRRLANCK